MNTVLCKSNANDYRALFFRYIVHFLDTFRTINRREIGTFLRYLVPTIYRSGDISLKRYIVEREEHHHDISLQWNFVSAIYFYRDLTKQHKKNLVGEHNTFHRSNSVWGWVCSFFCLPHITVIFCPGLIGDRSAMSDRDTSEYWLRLHFTWTSFSSMIFFILVLCAMVGTVYVKWIRFSPLIAIEARKWIEIFIRWLVPTWCFVLHNNRGVGFMRAFHI